MPPLEMMIYAPDLFTLVISEPCAIKTSLISLPIGNCDICVLNTLQGGIASKQKKKAATGKHPFLIIAPVMMRG